MSQPKPQTTKAREIADKIYSGIGWTPSKVGIDSPDEKTIQTIAEGLESAYRDGYKKRQEEFFAWLHT